MGWIIDTVQGTIELPPHRVQRLHNILASITPKIKVVATNHWHKILGELCSMSIAIPGAQGLFYLLQEVFRHVESGRPRIRLSKSVHGFLDDFRWLANDIASRPTQIAELVLSNPALLGACNAAGTGMGGVAFVLSHNPVDDNDVVPILWHKSFQIETPKNLFHFRTLQEASLIVTWNCVEILHTTILLHNLLI